jgi:hypothetical protein
LPRAAGCRPRTKAPAAALALLTVAAILATLPSAPVAPAQACPLPVGATGANGTCGDCHHSWGDAPLDGSVRIGGVPERFEPEHAYTLTVTLERGTGPSPYTSLSYAFELRATAGALAPQDAATTASRGPLEVASTTISEVTEWVVVWTAPEAGREVDFAAGAVVGDGDGTCAGDIPYAAYVKSYGPLDVPAEDARGAVPGTVALLLATVAVLVIVGYLLAFPRRERAVVATFEDDVPAEGPD